MNPTPDHLSDEILSALLDGATDAVAGDGARGTGGVPPTTAARAARDSVDAAAHLGACDRCAWRQAELAGARAALADAQVERLDELARRRLVAAALAAAELAPAVEAPAAAGAVPIGRARWARRHQALIGSAAAVVLAMLIGVPFVLDNGGSGGGEALTALAPDVEAAGTYLGDLGDLSDRSNLRLHLSGVATDSYAVPPREAGPSTAAGAAESAPLPAASPSAGGMAGEPGAAYSTTTVSPESLASGSRSSARPTNGSGATKSTAESPAADSAGTDQGFSNQLAYDNDQTARDRADIDRCVMALLDGPARGGKLVRSGTGTYQGRPAIVASFELAGGTEAFITDRSSCEVLDRFSV